MNPFSWFVITPKQEKVEFFDGIQFNLQGEIMSKQIILDDFKKAMKVKEQWQFINSDSGLCCKLFVGKKEVYIQRLSILGKPFDLPINYANVKKTIEAFENKLNHLEVI